MGGVLASNIHLAVVYYGSLQASKKVHNGKSIPTALTSGTQARTAMLETVLFATLRFHDTTSRGRLLNRFGKDVEGLDSSMADNCWQISGVRLC